MGVSGDSLRSVPLLPGCWALLDGLGTTLAAHPTAMATAKSNQNHFVGPFRQKILPLHSTRHGGSAASGLPSGLSRPAVTSRPFLPLHLVVILGYFPSSTLPKLLMERVQAPISRLLLGWAATCSSSSSSGICGHLAQIARTVATAAITKAVNHTL
jgi:hypothetical protein